MFNPGEPWYQLDPDEIHALGYGLMDGLKVWQRKPVIGYDEIAKLDISPEWKQDLQVKYHYYYLGFELPEVLSYLAVLAYLAIYQAPVLVRFGLAFAGITV